MNREAKILTAVLVGVVAVMIGVFALANSGSEESANKAVGDKTKIVREESHKTGSGPVQLVEYGDYQCPACGAAYPVVQQILKEYDGKVTFYFRNFPLVQPHPNAMAAAEAAETAGGLGKFWEMHDLLYEKQKDWSEETDPGDKFYGYAKQIGLDVDKFKKALADHKYKAVVDQDAADAEALSLQSTPTFFINGKQHMGKHDYSSLRDAIEAQLAAPKS